MVTDYNEYYNFVLEDPIWESPSETFIWYQKKKVILKYLKEALKNKTYARILDVGCNIGKDLFMINKQIKNKNINYVGVDISKKAIFSAKKYIKNEKLKNFHFFVKDITSDSIEDLGKFDIIICSELIEHLYHHEPILMKINHLLIDKGFLIITTPDKGSLFKKIILKLFPNVKDYQSWYFDRRGSKIKNEKERYMKNDSTIDQHVSEIDKKKLKKELISSGFYVLKIKSSAISYSSPVLDHNKFLFWFWLSIDLFFPFSSRFGYDSCALAKKVKSF